MVCLKNLDSPDDHAKGKIMAVMLLLDWMPFSPWDCMICCEVYIFTHTTIMLCYQQRGLTLPSFISTNKHTKHSTVTSGRGILHLTASNSSIYLNITTKLTCYGNVNDILTCDSTYQTGISLFSQILVIKMNKDIDQIGIYSYSFEFLSEKCINY